MKKMLFACAIAAGALAATQIARASTVTTSGSATFSDTGNDGLSGLNVNFSGGDGATNGDFSFILTNSAGSPNVYTATDTAFLTIDEAGDNLDGTDNVNVSFDITQPGAGSNSIAGTGSVNGYFYSQIGSVQWNNGGLTTIALAGGDTLTITLSNATLDGNTPSLSWGGVSWSCGNGSINYCGDASATFSLTVPAASPTPEPGSLALLGTSILGGAGLLRRRFRS